MSTDPNPQTPWVCPGHTEEHEDQLIGNREGFRLLRKKIDEVFEAGLARVNESGIEWIGLKLVADDPRQKPTPSRGRNLVRTLVVSIVVAAVLFVFVTGIKTIYSWFD